MLGYPAEELLLTIESRHARGVLTWRHRESLMFVSKGFEDVYREEG